MSDIETLLRTAMAEPDNAAALQEISRRADEVLDYLAADERDVDEEALRALERQPERLAQLLSAVAVEPELSDEDRKIMDELIEVRQASYESVGLAFKNGLMRIIRETHLSDWSEVFHGVPPVDSDWQQALRERADVQAVIGDQDIDIESLIKLGISPRTIWHATRAVSSVVDQLEAEGSLFSNQAMILTTDRDAAEQTYNALPPSRVEKEIVLLTRCTNAAAGPLLRWFIDLVQKCELFHLFPKLEAMPEGEQLRLTRTGGEFLSVQECWTAVHTPVPA